MDQLAFSIPEIYGGLAKVVGLAIIAADGMRLQYQTHDTIGGFYRSGVKELLVPWADVAAVDFRKGMFGATLHLRTASLTSLAGLPGCEGNELVLRFGRDRRGEVEAFAQRLQLRAANQTIDEISERLRQLRVP
jgi:hypothetical protein